MDTMMSDSDLPQINISSISQKAATDEAREANKCQLEQATGFDRPNDSTVMLSASHLEADHDPHSHDRDSSHTPAGILLLGPVVSPEYPYSTSEVTNEEHIGTIENLESSPHVCQQGDVTPPLSVVGSKIQSAGHGNSNQAKPIANVCSPSKESTSAPISESVISKAAEHDDAHRVFTLLEDANLPLPLERSLNNNISIVQFQEDLLPVTPRAADQDSSRTVLSPLLDSSPLFQRVGVQSKRRFLQSTSSPTPANSVQTTGTLFTDIASSSSSSRCTSLSPLSPVINSVERPVQAGDKRKLSSLTSSPPDLPVVQTSTITDPKTEEEDGKLTADPKIEEEPTNPPSSPPPAPAVDPPQTPPAVRRLRVKIAALSDKLSALKQEKATLQETFRSYPSNNEEEGGEEDAEVDMDAAAARTVKAHIQLLHRYNELKDVGTGMLGMIADARGCRIGEVFEEFGVEKGD